MAAIQMTRAEYQAKYGQAPVIQSTPTTTKPKVQMTRAQYEQKYGQAPVIKATQPVQPNVEQQRSELQAQGKPVSVNPEKAEPTAGGKLVRNILMPLAKVGANLDDMGELVKALASGDAEKMKETQKKVLEPTATNKYFGEVNKPDTLAEGVGIGAELGSYLVPGEGLALKGASLLKQPALKIASNLAKGGGIQGALGAGGRAVSEEKPIGEVAKQTAIGAGIGFGTGGALGLGGGAVRALPKVPGALRKASSPDITPDEALGYVLQGTPKDKKLGLKALSSVDTKEVKTYQELADKFKEKEPQLLKVVDDELAKDPALYKSADLSTKLKTKAGVEVSQNFVDDALKHLKEFYETSGDVLNSAEIDDIISRAKSTGITRKEVNDIARKYNAEFGQKAFSRATGEPLTSVNAQLFENTRKGLKGVARQGIGGAEAKVADDTLSAIYNTQRIINKNINAVNKLRQKIQKRGLFEKAGYYLTKYADILTGGTLRGAVGGLLPRGVGNKVMNALDIEEMLSKNLDVITKALESKDDLVVMKAVEKLRQSMPLDASAKNASSIITPQNPAIDAATMSSTTNASAANTAINGIVPQPLKKSIPKKPTNLSKATVPQTVGMPKKVIVAFDKSTNQDKIGKFELGSFGKNNEIRKLGQKDRFPISELDNTQKYIKKVYRAENNPISYRKDNIAWIAEMPNGEKRVIYTRLNKNGKEEILNWHVISDNKYLKQLESFGIPDQSRTGIFSLERSESIH